MCCSLFEFDLGGTLAISEEVDYDGVTGVLGLPKNIYLHYSLSSYTCHSPTPFPHGRNTSLAQIITDGSAGNLM